MVSVQGASFVHAPAESAPSLKPYLDQQQQSNQAANAYPQQLSNNSATLEQLAAALLSQQQPSNTSGVLPAQNNTAANALFGQSAGLNNVNMANLLGGQSNNTIAALLAQPSMLATLLEQLGLQAGGNGNLQAGSSSSPLAQTSTNSVPAAENTHLNASANSSSNAAGWPDLSDPKIFSLFAGATSAGQPSAPQTDMTNMGVYTSSGQQSTATSQWNSAKEPSQSAVLAALQSIQLKLQVQEQAVEYQNLEKQNQLLISSLLGAQQRIQELQAEVALLQHAMEKIDAAARMAEQEQHMREQVLQQRHAQLTASNMEAEMTIQQMEASLADVHLLQKDLNYNNIMLALGYSGATPENPSGASGVVGSMSVPGTPTPLSLPVGSVSAQPPASPAQTMPVGGLGAGATTPGGRSGAASYANRKCYNCGQKGHRAGDCPNPRTRPDAGADGADGADEAEPSLVSPSPAKIAPAPEFSLMAPATPDVGMAAFAVSRAPPAAPLAQPSPMTAALPPKDATPRAIGKKAGVETKSASMDSKSTPVKANQTRFEHKPRPPMLNASLTASPRMNKNHHQLPLTPTMVTPPLTPPSSWKNQIGISPLPPLTPTPVGTVYNRSVGRQNVARCIPWQN